MSTEEEAQTTVRARVDCGRMDAALIQVKEQRARDQSENQSQSDDRGRVGVNALQGPRSSLDTEVMGSNPGIRSQSYEERQTFPKPVPGP